MCSIRRLTSQIIPHASIGLVELHMRGLIATDTVTPIRRECCRCPRSNYDRLYLSSTDFICYVFTYIQCGLEGEIWALCGIAGWIGPPADPGRLQNMMNAIRHRGPDGEGQL